VGAQCAESLALNVRLETRIALAEKIIVAAKEWSGHAGLPRYGDQSLHWKSKAALDNAIQAYYSTGFLLFGPGGD